MLAATLKVGIPLATTLCLDSVDGDAGSWADDAGGLHSRGSDAGRDVKVKGRNATWGDVGG